MPHWNQLPGMQFAVKLRKEPPAPKSSASVVINMVELEKLSAQRS